LGIGDWGLGPIPNPQSPIPITYNLFDKYTRYLDNSNYKNLKLIKNLILSKKII